MVPLAFSAREGHQAVLCKGKYSASLAGGPLLCALSVGLGKGRDAAAMISFTDVRHRLYKS